MFNTNILATLVAFVLAMCSIKQFQKSNVYENYGLDMGSTMDVDSAYSGQNYQDLYLYKPVRDMRTDMGAGMNIINYLSNPDETVEEIEQEIEQVSQADPQLAQAIQRNARFAQDDVMVLNRSRFAGSDYFRGDLVVIEPGVVCSVSKKSRANAVGNSYFQ